MSQEEIAKKVKEAIESDPNRDYIQSISLFGSHLHGDARPDSDVDLLVVFRKSLSYFKLFDIQYGIEKKIGRKVDLVPRNSIDKYIKDEVLAEAKKIYEREPRKKR